MVNPTTGSQSNPNHSNEPNQPTAHLPSFDKPAFQQALAVLRTDNDRQCFKKFFIDLGQLIKERFATTNAAERRFQQYFNNVVIAKNNHHIVPMIKEAGRSLLRDLDIISLELHQKLDNETTRQGSKLRWAEADARVREATRRLHERHREIVYTHARLSQEDLQRYDQAMDDLKLTSDVLKIDFSTRIDQLADDTFQGTNIVFLGHTKFGTHFYVNSIYGWTSMVLSAHP